MLIQKSLGRSAAVVAILIVTISTAYGHVTVQPKQSATGAIEKYTLRVPTEKFVSTVRVEVEFPANLNVSSFEPKSGWKIEEKRDAAGKLVGVVLTGSIPTGESAAFTFSARNPSSEGKLFFKAIQIYEDGTKSEWTGAEGSRTPAPAVELKKPNQ
jgi:uncharacterized protein YcnI